MKHTYVIIDDDHNSVLKTRAIASRFQNLYYVGAASNYNDGLDIVLQHTPDIVFLEINPSRSSSGLSLQLINEFYRYLTKVPKIIVTTGDTLLAMEAIRYEVLDYHTKPFSESELRRTLLRYEKSLGAASPHFPAANHQDIISAAPFAQTPADISVTLTETESPFDSNDADAIVEEPAPVDDVTRIANEVPIIIDAETVVAATPLVIGVKSYGDYRFIDAKDICYLQADNNSTDIHLHNGEMITAFKTLKHFENVMPLPFVRIHNSYIINIDYVSRIHTGNSVCYIKNTTTKLPFSKSYKENVDAILNRISNGNYLEI